MPFFGQREGPMTMQTVVRTGMDLKKLSGRCRQVRPSDLAEYDRIDVFRPAGWLGPAEQELSE